MTLEEVLLIESFEIAKDSIGTLSTSCWSVLIYGESFTLKIGQG